VVCPFSSAPVGEEECCDQTRFRSPSLGTVRRSVPPPTRACTSAQHHQSDRKTPKPPQKEKPILRLGCCISDSSSSRAAADTSAQMRRIAVRRRLCQTTTTTKPIVNNDTTALARKAAGATYRPSTADTVEQHGAVLVHAAVRCASQRRGPRVPRWRARSRAGQRALRCGSSRSSACRRGCVH
jgi:hypothetical protein